MDYFVYIMCLNVRKAYSDLSGKPKIVQFDKYKQKHMDTAFNKKGVRNYIIWMDL